MSIKPLAVFSIALVFVAQNISLRAQSPAPAQASPSPAAPTPVPAEKSPTPGPRDVIDGLSQGDLNEAISQLKANYIDPASLSDQELSRATLQGLINRLSPGAAIFSQVPEPPAAGPFRAEILNDETGYMRLGSIAKGNIDEMDAALQKFHDKDLKSVILDLRATPASSDFDLAAEVLQRFCPKGKVLFSVKKTGEKQERTVTSGKDPVFHDLVVVLVDGDTAGAGEVIAAVLRMNANAMIVGANTAGQAVEFSDIPLSGGKILRVAVAEVILPGNATIFPKGIQPDIAVEVTPDMKQQVMQAGLDKGVSQLVFETEHPHLNEAALVAKTNPEIDAMEAAQKLRPGSTHAPLRDAALQHAVDLITSIDIYEGKPPDKPQPVSTPAPSPPPAQ